MNPKNKWVVIVGDPKPAYWESYTKETMPECHKVSIGTMVENYPQHTKDQAIAVRVKYDCDLWNYHVVKYSPRLKR